MTDFPSIAEYCKTLEERVDRFEAQALPDAMRACAVDIREQAQLKCPVRTGNLRGSISWELASEEGSHAISVGTNVPYAKAVEFGTGAKGDPAVEHGRYMIVYSHGANLIVPTPDRAPKPYLRPAVRATRADNVRRLKEAWDSVQS